VALALLTIGLLSFAERGRLPGSAPAAAPGFKEFAARLFTAYLLPVEVTGFLLLLAMLGVVVISKRVDTRGAAK
jgi:NADH-quinone oxidoreductase subunit J